MAKTNRQNGMVGAKGVIEREISSNKIVTTINFNLRKYLSNEISANCINVFVALWSNVTDQMFRRTDGRTQKQF